MNVFIWNLFDERVKPRSRHLNIRHLDQLQKQLNKIADTSGVEFVQVIHTGEVYVILVKSVPIFHFHIDPGGSSDDHRRLGADGALRSRTG